MEKKRKINQRDKNTNNSIYSVGGGKKTGSKIKSWANLRGALKHSLRIAGAGNVDPEHTDKNITLFGIEVPEDPEGATKALKERFESITEGLETTAKNGQPKVLCEDLLFTTSPLWWNRDENGNYLHDDKENKEKLEKWVKFHEEYIDKKFGKENVVYCNVQLDETTPHISCQVVPIRTDKTGKRHISHSHYFDGKVENSEGYKINKMAVAIGKYQQHINKLFPDLSPSIKPKKSPDKKECFFPKQEENRAKRRSVREFYEDLDEANKEVERLGDISEGLVIENELLKRNSTELKEEVNAYKELHEKIKGQIELSREIKERIENENLEMLEELYEKYNKQEEEIEVKLKENPNFEDFRSQKVKRPKP